MKKQLKIGAYIRVSTDKQVQIFEGSLDTQKFRVMEFVKNRNREIKDWGEIVEFYVEEGLSAGTDKRPEYQRMMSDVRKGKINLVLVHDVARLSRNTHDFEILLKELEKYGAGYLSMKEQFDTSTPAGRLMMNMVVNMAQFEREQVSERVSINCHSRATRGFLNGGKVVLGYDRDLVRSGTLIVNEEEAKKVVNIFEIFIEQGSIGKTLPELQARGIYPKMAISDEKKELSKTRWSYTGLQYLLSNKTYIGMKEVNKKNKNEDQEYLKPWQRYQVVKASWPRIISDKLFETAQSVLEESAKVERRRLEGSEKRVFILSGIIYCGECGNPLHGQSSHGANTVHRYYSHSKRMKNLTCQVKRLRADEVESHIMSYLSKTMAQVGYFDRIEENLCKAVDEQPKQIREEAQRIRKALGDMDTEIASIFKLQVQLGTGSEAAKLAAEHLEKLGNDRKAMSLRLADLSELENGFQETREMRNVIEGKVLEFRKGYPKATPAIKRRLVRKVLRQLIYLNGELNVYFNTTEERHNGGFIKDEQGKSVSIRNLGVSGPPALPRQAAGSDLILAFGNLRKDLNGWGGRTRTCE
ncbi:MAG: recombinase family protein [Pseudobdellovibrionaceae bacterium]